MVIIGTRTVGQAFGTVGEVRMARRAGNGYRAGKVIHTTEVVPYGCKRNAYVRAESWALDAGYEVAS